MKNELTEGLAILAQLASALTAERSALEQQDSQELQQAVALKSKLLEQLQANNKRRSSLLEAAGFNPDEQGFKAFLTTLGTGDAQEISALWSQLNQELEDCKEANQVNGKIVHRSKQSIDQLIRLMAGGNSSPDIYTASGATASIATSRPVVKA